MTSAAELRNGTCVVTLVGDFDHGNAQNLAAEIETCLREATSVLLDFGAVTFVDGAVMSLLQDILGRLDDSGWLGVARPLPWIERLFRVVGLSGLPEFRVFATLNEALEVIDRG